MDYNSSVKRKINEYFKDRWGLKDYRNGWMKGSCPYCGKYKFGIHIGKSKANCFSCGDKYNPIKVIMELEQMETKPQVFNLLKTFEGVDYLEPQIEKRDYLTIKLPESFRLLTFGNTELSKLARSYMKNRGFKVDKLSVKGIGYCTKGDYAGFIIFPFYQQGKLIYFIGRRFIQLGEKFKNPSVEDFGLGKSLLTYNPDCLAIYNKVYAFESIVNCLTVGDNALATLGKAVSNYQLSMILRSPVKDIVIGLDADALDWSIRLALKIVNYKRVKIIRFPEGKDVNNIGRKKTLQLEKEAPWETYQSLLKLKIKHGKQTELPY